jgi:hypothetical protein
MLFGIREQKSAARSARKSRCVTKRLNLQFLDLFGNACSKRLRADGIAPARSRAMPKNSGGNWELAENVIGRLLRLGSGVNHQLAIAPNLRQ